jgi:hypothetical protein
MKRKRRGGGCRTIATGKQRRRATATANSKFRLQSSDLAPHQTSCAIIPRHSPASPTASPDSTDDCSTTTASRQLTTYLPHCALIIASRPVDRILQNTEVNVIDTRMALAVDRSPLLPLLFPLRMLLARMSEKRGTTGMVSATIVVVTVAGLSWLS